MKKSNKVLLIVFLAVILIVFGIIIYGKLGNGAVSGSTHSFTLIVTDLDGNTTSRNIKTDEKYLGDALIKEGIVEGEQGPYGLYIKTVDGVLADYDVDQTYWAFYIGDELASTGVDTTEIVDGTTYTLKIEK